MPITFIPGNQSKARFGRAAVDGFEEDCGAQGAPYIWKQNQKRL